MENWNNINTGMGLGNMMGRQYNGFSPAAQSYNPPAPHYEIIKVNGEAGARNFRMGPNSSALLLDETAAIMNLESTGYDMGYILQQQDELKRYYADKIRTMNEKNLQFRHRGDGNYANYNFDDDDDYEEENYGYYNRDYMRNYPRYYR